MYAQRLRDFVGENRALFRSSCIVAAWGTKGILLNRDKQVLQFLAQWQNVQCLGVTKDGHPRHPLYIKGNTGLAAFPPGAMPQGV